MTEQTSPIAPTPGDLWPDPRHELKLALRRAEEAENVAAYATQEALKWWAAYQYGISESDLELLPENISDASLNSFAESFGTKKPKK